MCIHLHSVTARFGLAVAMALGVLFASSLAAAQPAPKVFRVGVLANGGRTPDGAAPAPLRDSLARLGYVEGKNIPYEARFAEGGAERLPGRAAGPGRLKGAGAAAPGGPAP